MTNIDKIIQLLCGSPEDIIQVASLIEALGDEEINTQLRSRISVDFKDRTVVVTIDDDELRAPISYYILGTLLQINIFNGENIKEVFFENINSEQLSIILQHLPNLETLGVYISHGYWRRKTAVELDFIPECIGNLKHLRFLYLEGHSGITSLPESMKKLTQLEKLSFAGMGLSCLPAWLLNCTNLATLNLNSMIKLKAIHPALINHPSLKKIYAAKSNWNGTVTPALPNIQQTVEKYKSMPIQELPRLSRHETKFRQDHYFDRSYNK